MSADPHPIRSGDDIPNLVVNTAIPFHPPNPPVAQYLPLPRLPDQEPGAPGLNVYNYNLFKDHLQEAVNIIPMPNPYQQREPNHYLKFHDIDNACYCVSKYVVYHIDRLHFYLSRTDPTIPYHDRLIEKLRRLIQMLVIINTLLHYERNVINDDREEIERAYFERLIEIL